MTELLVIPLWDPCLIKNGSEILVAEKNHCPKPRSRNNTYRYTCTITLRISKERVQQNIQTRNSILLAECYRHHVHGGSTSRRQLTEGNVLRYDIVVSGVAEIDTIHIGSFKYSIRMNWREKWLLIISFQIDSTNKHIIYLLKKKEGILRMEAILSEALRAAAVSVEKSGFPVPAPIPPNITTLPFSRCRIALCLL